MPHACGFLPNEWVCSSCLCLVSSRVRGWNYSCSAFPHFTSAKAVAGGLQSPAMRGGGQDCDGTTAGLATHAGGGVENTCVATRLGDLHEPDMDTPPYQAPCLKLRRALRRAR
eukprot:361949-Chlamydomonas_euryale.AAC.2